MDPSNNLTVGRKLCLAGEIPDNCWEYNEVPKGSTYVPNAILLATHASIKSKKKFIRIPKFMEYKWEYTN